LSRKRRLLIIKGIQYFEASVDISAAKSYAYICSEVEVD
jgi:hypothetical protein